MKLFEFFRKKTELKEEEFPWYGLSSIFEFIKGNLDDTGKLGDDGQKLPDEERRFGDNDLKWVAGGMDGAFGHHGNGGNSKKDARKAAALIEKIALRNSQKAKLELYHLLLKDSLMDFIDPALKIVYSSHLPKEPYLLKHIEWLAFESPDRGPVKFGIALLGIYGNKDHISKIITLGKHEEFSLYTVVALENVLESPEQEIWQLAKCIDGWGKIQAVERLENTNNSDIKRWLLREGYKNSIMHEYLAYTCAVTGNLKEALLSENIDDELLIGAGEIISALINGGPAEDMGDYEDGAEVVNLYVTHLEKSQSLEIDHFIFLKETQGYIEGLGSEIENKGWTSSLKKSLDTRISSICSNPRWREIVLERQNTSDDMEFWNIKRAANYLGIDLWDVFLRKVKNDTEDAGNWYDVMKHANRARIDEVIALAVEKLPLEKIAIGAGEELGIGEGFEPHNSLDFILQELGKYPNKGFELIKTALKSPVIRNRNFAMRALEEWKVENWPKETEDILRQVLNGEVNDDVKKNLKSLLYNGKLKD